MLNPSGGQYKHLSKTDMAGALALFHHCFATRTERQFREAMAATQQLIPIDTAHASVAELDAHGAVVATRRVVDLGFPTEWFRTYRQRNYWAVDPVARHLLDGSGPLVWSKLRARYFSPSERSFYEAARDYDLHDGFSFGQRLQRSPAASFFVCAGADIARHRRHLALLQLLTPPLHVALARVHEGLPRARSNLTRREIEVLKWARDGKSSWEMSLLLHISERTVRFHFDNAKRKLGASNRTHAITVALSQGLIEWT